MTNFTIEIGKFKVSFDNKMDADRAKKKYIKELKLKRWKGFWANTITGIELSTNY